MNDDFNFKLMLLYKQILEIDEAKQRNENLLADYLVFCLIESVKQDVSNLGGLPDLMNLALSMSSQPTTQQKDN